MIEPNTPLPILRYGLLAVAACILQPGAAAESPAEKPEAKSASKPVEHMNLQGLTITGHHELPRVLYIVPWKRAETGELPGRPPGSLLDEGLQPLDRGEFRREMRYSDQLATAAPAAATDTHQSTQSKSTGE